MLQYRTIILDFYKQKYPEHSIFRALMSLTYFADADEQMSPKTFEMPNWDKIKQRIQDLTEKVAKQQ